MATSSLEVPPGAVWRTEPLEQRLDDPPPLFAVLGAHPWAGASTAAAMWAPAADTEQAWPAHPTSTPLTVVVAQDTVKGLRAAARVLREPDEGLAPPDAVVVGLLIRPTRPGRLRKDVAAFRDTVAELLDDRPVWTLPWLDALSGQPPVLASWAPGDVPAKRDGPLDTVVPRRVAEIGEQICTRITTLRDQHLAAVP
ncbi:hypothetical protein [Williamsia sterculiae]|uniref:Uncharacterized protein n=1 Tax=Williamsia sterculiae TaxID=1344003 RepID=A0A1N7HEX3_9NOCA|nr:hypothetical protein [Williamsia sterculiae]SIS23291.1 hypothetical protein SAMN05445060_4091 [Williamsia sterculiae]